jgi:LemA protein
MNDKEIRIPEEMASEVLELASRYYADYTQSFAESELVAAGKEVRIPSEFIQKAIQEVQVQRRQKLEQQRQAKQQSQRLLSIGVGILAAIAIWGMWTYNTLMGSASRVDAAWAQVENQLQRRADLVPNLISVTQAYAQQEKALVTLLVQSRQAYLQALTPAQKADAIAKINQAIASFHQYAATNPQLQSSQLFINLQYEMAGTENRLAVERMRYNQAVQAYNQQIQAFPTSILAKAWGFHQQSFFQATK